MIGQSVGRSVGFVVRSVRGGRSAGWSGDRTVGEFSVGGGLGFIFSLLFYFGFFCCSVSFHWLSRGDIGLGGLVEGILMG